MDSLGDELSLGSMTKTICGVPRKVLKVMNVAVEKGCKLDEHIKKLEEEKRKIETSELELPLCLEMLKDAILYLKEENKRCSEMDAQPLLKDFISLNKPNREEDDKREELMREKKFQQWRANYHISNQRFSDTKIKNKLDIERIEDESSKVDTGLDLGLTSSSMVNGGRKGIASRCFTSNSTPHPPSPPTSPFLQQQAFRKQRRCWTPQLHRRFIDALQHLGGPGVARPKQITEHMQEEGLSNDEVKSHLQKYRLHIRKSKSNLEKQSENVLGFKLWKSSEEIGGGGESSKRSNSESSSPQGPLQTTTTTGGDSSMEDAESEIF